jgi:hypothetical protein
MTIIIDLSNVKQGGIDAALRGAVGQITATALSNITPQQRK